MYDSLQSGKRAIWRVPIDGGDPVRLTEASSSWLTVSPDGKWIAYGLLEDQLKLAKLAVIPFDGGRPANMFALPLTVNATWVRWMTDGRCLSYIDTRKGVSNIWTQPVESGPPRQSTDFKSEGIFVFAWSRDGKRLAVVRGNVTSDAVLVKNFQ